MAKRCRQATTFPRCLPRRAGARWWPTRHRAKSVPSPAPWAILATHASIQTLDPVLTAGPPQLPSEQSGHSLAGEPLPASARRRRGTLTASGAGQPDWDSEEEKEEEGREERETLGGDCSHSDGPRRLSERNECLRRGQKYITKRAASWVDASFSPRPPKHPGFFSN